MRVKPTVDYVLITYVYSMLYPTKVCTMWNFKLDLYLTQEVPP